MRNIIMIITKKRIAELRKGGSRKIRRNRKRMTGMKKTKRKV
jgi:hypothetical protein